jgi:hypothetical protein
MNTVALKRCKKCLIEKPATLEYFHKDKSRKDGFREICKVCRSKKTEKQINIKIGKKKCKKCKNVYDLNEDNFRKHKRSTDGYSNTCINCLLKEKYKDCKDGYKLCSKCENQYPITEEYFAKDPLCIDGFRNICKKCDGKRKEFGYTQKQEWTKEDKEILIKYYPYMSNKEIVENFFPTRTENQIRDYATKKLGLVKDEEYIKHMYWTKEQLDYLIEHYSNTNTKIIAEKIGKNEPAIRAMAIKLGVKKESFWTDEEVNLLIANYPFMKNIDLQQKFFPNKTISAIFNKAKKLNLHKNANYIKEMSKVRVKNIFNTKYKNIPLKGENHPLYCRIPVNCFQCGQTIYVTPSKAKKSIRIHCSKECASKTVGQILSNNKKFSEKIKASWTEEKKRKQAEKAIKRVKKMNKITETKPQIMVNNFLNELGIKYINEYECRYYLIDNYLIDYDLMIEVQGNFFHCNPVMNLQNSRKTKIIAKDKSKNTYIKKYYGIDILYLWEKDIMENPDLCKKLITEYVNNGGILDNYHSFNYILDENGDLELLEELYEIGY